MPLERRTRVEIFLPVRTDSRDYHTITDWLAEELAYARGGSTLTTPFTGLYTSITRADIIRDDVHVLFCDFDLDAGFAQKLLKKYFCSKSPKAAQKVGVI